MLKLSQTIQWRLFVRNLCFSVKSEEKFSSIASAIISPEGSALGVQIFTHFLFIIITRQIIK